MNKIESTVVYGDSLITERLFLLDHLLFKSNTCHLPNNIICDWDETLNAFVNSEILYCINRKISFWLNYLINNDINIFVITAASHSRVYEQAFNVSTISLALTQSSRLHFYTDILCYLNGAPTRFHFFPEGFSDHLYDAHSFLLRHGWTKSEDNRPPRFLYRCYNEFSESIFEQTKYMNDILLPYQYHTTLHVSNNHWAMKIHYVNKNDIFNLNIPGLNEEGTIILADDAGQFGIDTPLFNNEKIPIKINVGNALHHHTETINTTIKNVSASLAFLEAFAAIAIKNNNPIFKNLTSLSKILLDNNIYLADELTNFWDFLFTYYHSQNPPISTFPRALK